MKALLLSVAMLLFVSFTFAQKINWMSFEDAIELQKRAPKKIMVDMYTVWCGPCKMLDRNTFANADVVQYVNDNYYAVKFNAEGNDVVEFNGITFSNPNYDPAKSQRRNAQHQLASYYKVQAYPTIVFLDEDAQFLSPIRGYKTPQQLELYLKLFKNDDHKTMSSQEDFDAYYRAFKPEFQQ